MKDTTLSEANDLMARLRCDGRIQDVATIERVLSRLSTQGHLLTSMERTIDQLRKAEA